MMLSKLVGSMNADLREPQPVHQVEAMYQFITYLPNLIAMGAGSENDRDQTGAAFSRLEGVVSVFLVVVVVVVAAGVVVVVGTLLRRARLPVNTNVLR